MTRRSILSEVVAGVRSSLKVTLLCCIFVVAAEVVVEVGVR